MTLETCRSLLAMAGLSIACSNILTTLSTDVFVDQNRPLVRIMAIDAGQITMGACFELIDLLVVPDEPTFCWWFGPKTTSLMALSARIL